MKLLKVFGKLVLLLVFVLIVYEFWILAQIGWMRWFNPGASAFMERRLAVMQEKNPKARLKHLWFEYARISVHLKRALIVSEDAKFVNHEGFDWAAIEKALEKNLQRGKVVSGGSTISQQLAKNLFLSSDRSLIRKVQEAIITLMLEAVLPKRRIFEIYLNIIEWGEGVFGAQAAATHYFQINAGQLNEWQAARLAAMVPSPRYFDKNRNAPYLDRQTETLLTRMPAAVVP
ncbi:MAG: monofunctional biosynthetic peptidoglycan transglycosylase [Betaproteobacteria bacterium]|nr:monofunctional biosynthetic peptidoglycan transglycosylase [Betaproteobacteria bacterium]